ncbi:MAG TPA: cytochrome P450 [Frankiaceae bacterium]|nr:cytochrome P450 [Frankiaceae bacterium]
MSAAADLDLPFVDPNDPELRGDRFVATMTALADSSWLARTPLGYLTLDREAGEFFLRNRSATFPGQKIAELFGIDAGPLREEIDRNILHIDGQDHRRLRNLLNPFFTPRAADRWRPTMRSWLASIWSDLGGATSCDVVDAIAKPYPSLTIATVMGAPPEDAPRLQEWSTWIQRQFDGPSLLTERARIEQACREFYAWCDDLLARRHGDPGDDLISVLIAAEEEGSRLSDVELVHLVLNVLIGGVDTTQAQLCHALRLFAEHPEQWELLRREPERVSAAVQEVLHHMPITPFTARILTADVEYRDVRFPTGTVVMVCSFTGNRDGAGTAAFDITAERGTRLLTFGAGIHYCVGSNLARAELEEALSFLAARMPRLRATQPPAFGTVQGIYEMQSLQLSWDT